MAGVIFNPTLGPSNPDGASPPNFGTGKGLELYVAEIHGKSYTATYRGASFAMSVAAVTLPVNAATLASVFSVYNPPGSGRVLELLAMDWATVVATTVVTGFGIYTQGPATASKATFTTPVTPTSLLVGGNTSSVAIGYSALTASGTPTLTALFGGNGAVTSTYEGVNSYDFQGRVVLTAGSILHVATTTAATTASGFTGVLSWAEWPA